MAQVDFSNAVLDVREDKKPLTYDQYLSLGLSQTFYIYTGGAYEPINTNATMSVITNTPSKISILYTGQFIASGTSFIIGSYVLWEVSNVSFSNGDTYSFIIDIDVSGNS